MALLISKLDSFHFKISTCVAVFSFSSIRFGKKKKIKSCMSLEMKHIHLFILYKECCTTFNCFCWKHTKKSWKYCTFICIKIFWWQQYLDLFYTLNYFSRCCFIFILHVCYAFTLLAFYIYIHILKEGKTQDYLFSMILL